MLREQHKIATKRALPQNKDSVVKKRRKDRKAKLRRLSRANNKMLVSVCACIHVCV